MDRQRQTNFPHVIRLDIMPLDCGDGAAVIELEQAPTRAWHKAFKRVLGEVDGLETVQARCDGRFIYIVGLEPGQRGTQHRLLQALADATLRTGSRPPAANVPAMGAQFA